MVHKSKRGRKQRYTPFLHFGSREKPCFDIVPYDVPSGHLHIINEYGLHQVTTMAAFGLTLEMIAAVINCNLDWLRDTANRDKVNAAFEQGRLMGDGELLAAQYLMAMDKPEMSKWVGVNRLGQNDRNIDTDVPTRLDIILHNSEEDIMAEKEEEELEKEVRKQLKLDSKDKED